MPQTAAPAKLTSLPGKIEIFRAGQHIDDAGKVYNFSEADVADIAIGYNPKLREAPLTIGHPAHNLPAYGWVNGLGVNDGGRLVMDTHQVQPQFAEMVDRKQFKKRSASFYAPEHPNNPTPGKWYLRHVAFLGAQPPAIAGLADFSEGGDPANTVCFSEPLTTNQQEQDPMDEELKKQLDAANAAKDAAEQEAKEAREQLAQFAEAAKRDRVAGFTSFCEAQIQAGTLLPKEKDAAVAVLETLADAKEVSFAEGGATKAVPAVDFLKDLIARAKPVVSFGEHAAGAASSGQATKDMTDAQVDKLAREHATKHSVSYAEGLKAVTASFTTAA
jgi:hypothetical protein